MAHHTAPAAIRIGHPYAYTPLTVYDLHHLRGVTFANGRALRKDLFDASEIIVSQADVHCADILFEPGETAWVSSTGKPSS